VGGATAPALAGLDVLMVVDGSIRRALPGSVSQVLT
jgi:hypothetical protein